MKENHSTDEIGNWSGETQKQGRELIRVCHIAWKESLMAGWSGNASLRLADNPARFLLTRAGAAKGALTLLDFVIMDVSGAIVAGSARPSSEFNLHSAIYAAFPSCDAILHTHPAYLQALSLSLGGLCGEGSRIDKSFLNLNLHEARMWRDHLAFAPDFPPGSPQLAKAAADALAEKIASPQSGPCAVWLAGHGLCALGPDVRSCLCLTEELEHLAKVQLLCREGI